jgi:hypothetical protein
VTMIFLAVLPRLPVGAMVHVHDIYLPDDYPRPLLNRFWSEQCVLAAWLLGGSRRLRPVLPGARLPQTEAGRKFLAAYLPPGRSVATSSFWFEVA